MCPRDNIYTGHRVNFHIVDDSFLIDQDGILEFMVDTQTNIDYVEAQIRMGDTFIPFTTMNKIRLQGRNSLPFYINIANPEVKEGYVPRI